jgi:hypothetical protein
VLSLLIAVVAWRLATSVPIDEDDEESDEPEPQMVN